jgi:nitrogen fixation protein
MLYQEARRFDLIAATPTYVTPNDIGEWELDTGDGISGQITLAHGWGLASPHLVFYVPAATAGTLGLRLRVRRLAFLDLATKAYDYDVALTTTVHPQNIPLPMIFDNQVIAGNAFDVRVDRSDALAAVCRIRGINWEIVG